jgi:hypothetical protein
MAFYLNNFRRHFTVRSEDIVAKDRSAFCELPGPDMFWQTKTFFGLVTRDPCFAEDGDWVIFALEPNPFLYFHRLFGMFPLIVGSSLASASDYIEAIHADPGDSPADAIATRSDVVVVSSRYGSALYCFDERSDFCAGFRSVTPRPFTA